MAGLSDWLSSLFPSAGGSIQGTSIPGDAGQAEAAAQQPSLTNWMQGNQQTLMGLGLGLMSGDSKADAYRNAMLGAQRGVVLDASANKEKKADEEKKKRQMAYQQLAQRGMIPAEFANDPELAQQALMASYRNRLEQSNPSAIEKALLAAGVQRGSDEWHSAMRNAAGLNKAGMQEVDPEKGYIRTDASGNATYIPPGGMNGGGMTPKQVERETKFREEVNKLPSVAQFNVAAPVYQSMHDTAGRGDQYSDLNLVYGLAKIFDPGSVVREGEQTLVRESQAWPEWLKGQIASVQGGAKLTPESRQKIMTEARSRVNAYRQQADTDLNRYGKISDQYGFDRGRTMPTLGDVPEWKAPETAADALSGGSQIPRVNSMEEARALREKGYRGFFIGPDGQRRRIN